MYKQPIFLQTLRSEILLADPEEYTNHLHDGCYDTPTWRLRQICTHSYQAFVQDNPTADIYTWTADQLESPTNYLDRRYKYFSDKRLRDLDLKASCGCGGGEGLYTYLWDVGAEPSDFNTWHHRVTITLPSVNGSSRIIDYNKYGQTLNHIAQEVAGNPSSRRWIRTWTRDATGRLTDSYSVAACQSYNDTNHTVQLWAPAKGQRHQFTYDANSALATVKLWNVNTGIWNFQAKQTFTLYPSGDRRRFLKTLDRAYRVETNSENPASANDYADTTFVYTFHASDALAAKLRTTTLPAIVAGENGSGASVLLKDYFETDGLHTWTKDGDAFVHYTGFDANRRTATKQVVNLNTSSPPSGVPSPPDPVFSTTSGLNLVTDMEYDALRRMTKHVSPDFTDNAGAVVSITKRWWHTKLSNGEQVMIEYPHVGGSGYYHAALTLTVRDLEGHVQTRALGELGFAYRDTNLADDFDPTGSTVEEGFHGMIVRRTDFIYQGDKVTQEDIWIDADGLNVSSNKYSTIHTYDTSGRRLTTKNAVGTITRWTYDVLDRRKTTKIGTVDGGAQDNMTLVEELFFDAEEVSSSNVGDGTLTQIKRYTDTGVARTTDQTFDYRLRLTQVDEPISIRETRAYTNRNQVSMVQRFDDVGDILMSKTENFFDAWGQPYETREHGVSGGVASGYASVRTWRNGRGLVVKELSRGKVLQKTQYDGAGRVTNQAVSYDTAETAYADADDLTGDTVMQEARLTLDKVGGSRLVATYERRHDGTGTGGLTVGTSGNGRAEYGATWHDKLHRPTHIVNYGTNGGVDMTDRPAGNPPTSSSTSSLVAKNTYTIKSEVLQATDPQAIITQSEYDDNGRLTKRIENYVDGTPGPGTDQDRTTEWTYNGENQVLKTTAKGSGVDQVTENVYGVTQGASFPDSKIASNGLLKLIKYPDPTTGQPSGNAVDQESFAYNAQGERIWRKDQQSTEHTLVLDDRGRLTHDRVTALGSGIEGSIRRISTTYDALDRPVRVSSYDNHAVGVGTVQNEVLYEYGRYSTVTKLYQEWAGSVNILTSRKVQYTFSYPTNGTTAVRRTSTTYTDGTTVIDDVYSTGTDDTISRVSGQKKAGTWLFQESYLGLGRLVRRQYGTTSVEWTLVGTDTPNNDNYVGLDRFARIDDLVVKNGGTNLNRYLYSYNYNSQVTLRDDLVGNVGGSYEFDESFTYDNVRRLTDHQRGAWNGSAMSPLKLHECWTLDRSGNTSPYYNGTASTCGTTYTAGYNASNELTSWSLGSVAYNDAGDQTARGNFTYIYDAWNRLKEVQIFLITTAYYHYNGLGQKIASTYTDPARYYYFSDQWQILEERDLTDGTLLQNYVWGTQYIDDLALRNAASPEFMAWDVNFNVTTRINSSGAVVARHVYDAYGKPKQLSADWSTWQSITEDLHLFTGRLYVRQHEQYDFRHRTQDPQLGRFLQRDPIGIWEDDASFGNGYAYVGNDPADLGDPFGLSIQPDLIADPRAMVQKVMGIAADVQASQSIYHMFKVYVTFQIITTQFWAGLNTNGRNQFVFTCKCGWLDMGHFWMAAFGGYAIGYNRTMEYAYYVELSQSIPLQFINHYRKKRFASYHRVWSPFGWADSAWTPEDMISNQLGAFFGSELKRARIRQPVTIATAFQSLLKACNAVPVNGETSAWLSGEALRWSGNGAGPDVVRDGDPGEFINTRVWSSIGGVISIRPRVGMAYRKLCRKNLSSPEAMDTNYVPRDWTGEW